MTKTNFSQREISSPNRQLVSELQEERSAVWAMYCKIAEMKPQFADDKKVRPLLSRFAQLLIDYVSLGHFGIYEHLLTKEPQPFAVLCYANSLYPAFSNTTDSAILFNDVYFESEHHLNTDKLATDLSTLGENLAKRMELEDRLCSMLLN